MGVARIFTPGAPTTEIVDWVRSALSREEPAVGSQEPVG
jgi:methylmalonyl-CoA mutase cobalamin-binding subunit